jgi:F-box protein 9
VPEGWAFTSSDCKQLTALARLLTLSSPDLYRTACRLVYRPPFQLAPTDATEDGLSDDPDDPSICDALCLRSYSGDWRRFWLEHPRLRTDGCFISVVSYVRRGEGDNAWIAPSHIVTYFRFVSGQSLSCT